MKITAEQIIEFVINHGNEHGVTMKNVEVVGIETCVEQAPRCNANYEVGATVYDVLSCYFSHNFKCALRDAIAYKNAEYIIHVVEYFGRYDEYGYDYEVAGGSVAYCNSEEEMQKETERLKKETDIGYLVYDKSENEIERFNWHPLF